MYQMNFSTFTTLNIINLCILLVRISRLNLGFESVKTINIYLFCKKVKGLTLVFKTWWVILLFVKFLVEMHGFECTWYTVSSSGYRIHGFKGTGYLI